ncbi:MAG TPA: hypothetical protein VJP78_13655 [Thermoleophilia bacterium]|nr:hypothetical protein [Thermoleophilia bacterium]
MRITARHHIDLGDEGARALGPTLLSAKAWDALRLDGPGGDPFTIPQDRVIWIERCLEDATVVRRAEEVASLARSLGVRRLFSLGVGCAWLEYNLKRVDPSLHLTCTDFAPGGIERLRSVFVECDETLRFDMLEDDFPQGPDMYLLHRIDTELDDRQWREVFSRMGRTGVRHLLFIPSGILGPRTWARERARAFVSWIRMRRLVFAGYLRTEARFRALWDGLYCVVWAGSLGGLRGFLLQPAES